MTNTTKNAGLSVKSAIKAGGVKAYNHNRKVLAVKTGVKAGGFQMNHTRGALNVKTGVKAGGVRAYNHNRSLARIV